MKVLLIGSGGREHALGWKLTQSNRVSELFSLPGNPGLSELGALIEGVSPIDAGQVASVAVQLGVDLVVVGPEAPLAGGVVDAVHRSGIPTFGPTRSAARLESSKWFAKEIMARAGVATARAARFAERQPALAYLAEHSAPYVVKADGLAGGKGVLVSEDHGEAVAWVDRCLGGGFGDAGRAVVIEDYLAGPEVSFFALCAGERALVLEPARDYKRLLDGDHGPNTGGMGSYSPVGQLPDGLVAEVTNKMIEPTLRQLAGEGSPYSGFLYVGLVLTDSGPKVLEFNCRLGDPEAQALLPRLETDLIDVMEALLNDTDPPALRWSPMASVCVVLVAQGYPHSPRKGDVVHGLNKVTEAHVFQAGTKRDLKGKIRTSGGRVLSLVGTGGTIPAARHQAYAAADVVQFAGKQFRQDIAS